MTHAALPNKTNENTAVISVVNENSVVSIAIYIYEKGL